MKGLDLKAFALASLAGFLLAGLPWWTAPYNRFHLSDPLSVAAVLVFCLAAGSLGWRRRPLPVIGLFLGVPAAVMARVIVDTLRDPTSHNLWPFEIVLAMVLAGALALPAALLGWGAGKLLRLGGDA
jgi:hypothetical protein